LRENDENITLSSRPKQIDLIDFNHVPKRPEVIKMKFSKVIILLIMFTGLNLHAQNFEIIDGTANVAGKPSSSPNQARENWTAACDQWKSETKDLNKSNEVMMLSCENPACTSDNAMFSCSSQASFKVKTSGTFAQHPPQPEPVQVEQTIVSTPPPQLIVEAAPAPRPGFIWIGGYWGWHGTRHLWYPGHWDHSRVGYTWVQPRWVAHGHNWRLEGGKWRR
jgi:WXXGXW repeat (2 copies)